MLNARSPQAFRRARRSLFAVAPVVLLVSACGNTTPARTVAPTAPDNAVVAGTTSAAPVLTLAPADGASQVRLDAPVTVSVANGVLDKVDVTADGGTPLAGTYDSGHTTWTASGLDPAAHYTVSAAAHGAGGHATGAAAFATLAATKLTTDVFPGDGASVGVGMPIILKFNGAVDAAQQAALVKRIEVHTSTPVEGAWHWFGNQEVHFRPKDYWPTGTKVEVDAHLKGAQASGSLWGLGDFTSTFTIGPKHVSIIDAVSHQMQVFENDQLVHTYPISAGKPSSPTISGTLFVWYKLQQVKMVSTSIGIPVNAPGGYDEKVFWDTAISTDGFYVHAAPWSVAQQGNTNVSHGCVNLSTANATEFFNFSLVGDIVQVKGTDRQADYSDGEADWQIPFDQYANSGGVSQGAPAANTSGGGGI